MIEKTGAYVCQNYTAWVNKRTMRNHFIPYYKDYATKDDSLLILDNCGSHVADEVINDLNKEKLSYIFLAPNATPLLQPVDISIGRSIKQIVKNQFHDWMVENFENIVEYNEEKKKYKFMSPTKSLMVQWILQAYERINSDLIKKSKFYIYYN